MTENNQPYQNNNINFKNSLYGFDFQPKPQDSQNTQTQFDNSQTYSNDQSFDSNPSQQLDDQNYFFYHNKDEATRESVAYQTSEVEEYETVEESGSLVGKLIYAVILGVIIVGLIGLPVMYLLNQNEENNNQQIAGIGEDRSWENSNNNNEDKLGNPQNRSNEVFVYDPESGNFFKKEDNQENTLTDQNNNSQNSGATNLNPNNPINGVSFAEAFALARSQLGPNAVFEWNGQLYTTNLQSDETNNSSSSSIYPKNIFSNLNPKTKFVSDDNSRVLEINECNLNVKYPLRTANNAMVDFDRIQPAEYARPFWNFYAFTGYKTPTEKFGEGYTVFVQCFNISQMSEAFRASLTGKNIVSPEELFDKTGWFIADDSIRDLQMSRNENLGHAYSVVFTRNGILYSMNFMSKPKDSNDKIGGLYAYQVQMQFQDWTR